MFVLKPTFPLRAPPPIGPAQSDQRWCRQVVPYKKIQGSYGVFIRRYVSVVLADVHVHCVCFLISVCVLSDHDTSPSLPSCRAPVLPGTVPTCGQQTLHSTVMTAPPISAPYLSAVAPPTKRHPQRIPPSQGHL